MRPCIHSVYIVLDPFAGCGTFLVSAQRLKRQWIGIDISPTAVGLMKRRMEKVALGRSSSSTCRRRWTSSGSSSPSSSRTG
ncbi:MAG TPA: DNA methyltransferase [Actinomycetota bacterium]|nr:DNA methyltransferase [Actinomycetota bacterium]